ncbi:hypothetical protein PHMEG_0005410 [Phytophthora megakarya]|uniref:Uncharacterized protein n=1 Tax=Phytophthora megakarya TaxID=4795 RepID=A0A225WTF1_9STRA|nr:hypothetical protein PHMEG_0005410 [Phytophthora megakarya]
MNQDWDLQDRKLHDDEQRRENEVTRSLEHDEDQDDSCVYRVYTPQLMDTQEMQALRMALNRIEMQIQEEGHMQEYAPRKTTSSKLRQWYGLPRNSRSIKRPTMSAGPSSALNPKSNAKRASPTKSPHAGLKTVDFERTLKEETRQNWRVDMRIPSARCLK